MELLILSLLSSKAIAAVVKVLGGIINCFATCQFDFSIVRCAVDMTTLGLISAPVSGLFTEFDRLAMYVTAYMLH